jgi:hypothetical protein
MAGDWIKMRRGLRHDPKVIAMARTLAADRQFMAWWTDPQQMACRHIVTEVVTFANVTRVTVCGLLDVWAALNNTLSDDCTAAFMTLQDLDDIAEIPGFGNAMEQVGWVTQPDTGGLEFQNFNEHNTTAKNRPQAATAAERAKAYRDRKKAMADAQPEPPNTVTNVTSRHTEKRREDRVQQQQHAGATPEPAAAEAGSITRLHPHCTQLEAEQWAVHHNANALDGVMITPEIVVGWWEDRTRTEWQTVKQGTRIPLSSPKAVETDLVAYARAWARNANTPKPDFGRKPPKEIVLTSKPNNGW